MFTARLGGHRGNVPLNEWNGCDYEIRPQSLAASYMIEMKYHRTLLSSIPSHRTGLDEITESLKKVILWNLIFIFKYKETKKV